MRYIFLFVIWLSPDFFGHFDSIKLLLDIFVLSLIDPVRIWRRPRRTACPRPCHAIRSTEVITGQQSMGASPSTCCQQGHWSDKEVLR